MTRAARRLTHLDGRGRLRMVDVGGKPVTRRVAVAGGSITMSAAAYAAVRRGAVGKGDVLAAARLAGIAGAKRTAELIPLCHAVPLDQVTVDLRFDDRRRAIRVEAAARTSFRTGVEMEAMTATAVALLTLYDMAKGIDRGMVLGPIRLLEKSGGRSGRYALRGRRATRAR